MDQSLADLAHFITKMKSDTNTNNRISGILMVGGSYAGTMVTWFRQKYPHLVNGVWASSAPVKAKLDFFEYKEVVGDLFMKYGGIECYERLRKCLPTIQQLIEDRKVDRLKNLFRLCDSFDETNDYDLWYFHVTLSDVLSSVDQNHRFIRYSF